MKKKNGEQAHCAQNTKTTAQLRGNIAYKHNKIYSNNDSSFI